MMAGCLEVASGILAQPSGRAFLDCVRERVESTMPCCKVESADSKQCTWLNAKVA